METNEKLLLAMAAVPAISGHPIHQGTPREAFCHTFLEKHLAQTVAVSSGEVIDASSRPGEKRSQFDIVIYNRAFPKLDYGGGITGFLSESVIATIEVKSTLNKEGLRKALAAARRLKALRRGFESCSSTGCRPPGILSYVVAYDGPSSMRTVHGWLGGLHYELSIESSCRGCLRLWRNAPQCPHRRWTGSSFSARASCSSTTHRSLSCMIPLTVPSLLMASGHVLTWRAVAF